MHKEVFFSLVRAGLWEGDVKVNGLSQNDFDSAELKAVPKGQADGLKVNDLPTAIDYNKIFQLAEEQSILGLATAGLEWLTAYRLPLTEKLTLLGKCQLIEQRNVEMNQFVGELVGKLRKAGINAVLVKGQGVAQCYAKPLWRSSGDVDLLLDEENYKKAKQLLMPLATDVGKEFEYNLHQSLTIGSFTVELHGSQRCGLSKSMDAVIDEVQREVCENGKVRTWMNGDVPINLPAPNEDVILVFTHCLKHFYKGGLGLRQICDWCRLLWSYRETIDLLLLKSRLREMRLMSEWKAFGAFAVESLGVPVEAMLLYDDSNRWKRKASLIEDFILTSGSFGQNRATSYAERSYITKKAHSMGRRISDLSSHARIFPMDSVRFMPTIMFHGLMSAARGE